MAHQNAPRRLARPTRPRRASTGTHTLDPGVASSDPQRRCRCPHQKPRCTSRVARRGTDGTANQTRQSPGPYTPNNQSARSPRPKPEGPERVQRGASPAPLPRQRRAAGTKSPVVTRPPRAPRSRAGVREGTGATGKLTGAPRATGPDEARRTNAGPRGTTERHAAGHNHGARTGAKHHGPTGAANPGSTHNTQILETILEQILEKHGTGEGAKENQAPTPAHRTHSQWVAGPGHTPK